MTNSQGSNESSPKPTQSNQGSTAKGWFLGCSVQLAGYFLARVLVSLVYGVHLIRSGMPGPKVGEILSSNELFTVQHIAQLVIGLGVSFFAGLIALQSSGTKGRLALLMLMITTLTLGTLFRFAGETLSNLIVGSLVLGAQLIGGLYAEKRNPA